MSFENAYRDWHTKVSYVKSFVRLAASAGALYFVNEPSTALFIFALGFGIAEVLGVLEEWL